MLEERLLKLKEEIEKAKVRKTELEARKKIIQEELKTEWGCNSMEEVKQTVNKLKEQIENLRKEIEEGIKELEENYASIGEI